MKSLSGIILVDKPMDLTSHDVVARARRSLGIRKIGHAGTLDPFATGLLVLMVGEGTKLSDALMDGEKEYIATVKLGQKRNSGDRTGDIVGERSCNHLTRDALLKVLPKFCGRVRQIPPMHSAVKQKGMPLYKLARKGLDVERKAREVEVRKIDLLELEAPSLTLRIVCSKGTYIRTLVEDIAEAVDTFAYVEELRRLRSGTFHVDQAIRLEVLEKSDQVMKAILPLSESIPAIPEVIVETGAVEKISNGGALKADMVETFRPSRIAMGETIKVVDAGGTLLSLGRTETEFDKNHIFSPDSVVGKSFRVFNLS